MFNWLKILAIYLPFELALNPTEGIDLASIRVLILALFLIWLAKGLKDKKIVIKNNLINALIVIFLFMNVISIFWARNADWSVRKILFLLSVFPLYFVASSVISDFSRVTKMTKMLLAGGFLVSILGLLQFFGQFAFGLDRVYKFWANFVIGPFLGKSFSIAVLQNPSWLVNVSGTTYLRATATFPDPHMFSFFLGMLIPLALSLYMAEKKRIYLIYLAVMLLADIFTFSRGGYLGLFSGIVFIIIFFWGNISQRLKIAGFAIMALLALSLIIPSPISERFFSSFNLREGSNQGRLETWAQAVNVIDDHLLLGVGIGNYPLYIKPTADYREPIYAHDTYLDIAAETGILSVLAWTGIMFLAGWVFLKKTKENIFFLGGAAAIIIFSVHSLVETAIYSPVVLTLLMIILGFSQIDCKKNNENI